MHQLAQARLHPHSTLLAQKSYRPKAGIWVILTRAHLHSLQFRLSFFDYKSACPDPFILLEAQVLNVKHRPKLQLILLCISSDFLFTCHPSGMFDRLPLEIQYMIYSLVLIHVDTIKTCRQKDIIPISRNELSLLAINHYVRSVTLPLFWGKNTFCFDASSYPDIRVCTIHRNSSTPKTFRRCLTGWLTTIINDSVGRAFFGPKNPALFGIFGGLGSIYHSQCTKACGPRHGAQGWLH
jgi:hypothetical protein